jgi:hypothetical protein
MTKTLTLHVCHLCDKLTRFVRQERGYIFDVPLCGECRDKEIAKAERERERDDARD